MFEAKNISYQRGGRHLFVELSFCLSEGKALHIKGDNGAGKSSLLKLLTGSARVDQGNINWKGSSILSENDDFYKQLLFIGHKAGLSQHLSAEENLNWYASLSGCALKQSDCEQAFKSFGLYGFEDIAAAKLSAGQQRRIALCRLLLEKKKLWVLDEPLVSLDKQGVKLFENLLKDHLKNGGLTIYTSHQDIISDASLIQTINLADFNTQQAEFSEEMEV